MNVHSHEHHTVLDAIAAWIKKYREAIGTQNELANCTPEQVAAIARDMGLSPGELRFMAAKGPHAADELPKLLRALGVDPQQLASKDPGKMRDLHRPSPPVRDRTRMAERRRPAGLPHKFSCRRQRVLLERR